jgi:hypothetical protein
MKKINCALIAISLLFISGNSVSPQWLNMIKENLFNWEKLKGTAAFKLDKEACKVGNQVKLKNIRIMTTDLQKYATKYFPGIPQISYLDNTLTER